MERSRIVCFSRKNLSFREQRDALMRLCHQYADTSRLSRVNTCVGRSEMDVTASDHIVESHVDRGGRFAMGQHGGPVRLRTLRSRSFLWCCNRSYLWIRQHRSFTERRKMRRRMFRPHRFKFRIRIVLEKSHRLDNH